MRFTGKSSSGARSPEHSRITVHRWRLSCPRPCAPPRSGDRRRTSVLDNMALWGCYWVCTAPHCRTVCAKTRMKRIVKTPMPTPMSTNSVPTAPSPARGRIRRSYGMVEWVTELGAICWRTAPALAKSKRAIADLRKIATAYTRATADKISRRNPLSHRKGHIKSVEKATASNPINARADLARDPGTALSQLARTASELLRYLSPSTSGRSFEPQTATSASRQRARPKGSGSWRIFTGRERHPSGVFTPACSRSARRRPAPSTRGGLCAGFDPHLRHSAARSWSCDAQHDFESNFHGYRHLKIVRPQSRSRHSPIRRVAIRARSPRDGQRSHRYVLCRAGAKNTVRHRT